METTVYRPLGCRGRAVGLGHMFSAPDSRSLISS